MRVNLKLIQLIGEAAIPLAGFFWWNWSLYFIVIFYLLDYLCNEVIINLKSKKITTFQNIDQQKWINYGLLSVVLFVGVFFLIHFTMRSIHPRIDFLKELLKFWNYTEMGIKQGPFLFPLVALLGFQRYKMEFIRAEKFKQISLDQLWKPHHNAQLIMVGCIALVFGVSQFIVFPELVYILGIVAATSTYTLLRK